MKLGDLVLFGKERAGLEEKAVLAGREVVVKLVSEGVLSDIRACLGAPVPPEGDRHGGRSGAHDAIFHAECIADSARMKRLEIAAAAGVTVPLKVRTQKESGALVEREGEFTASECSAMDAAYAANGAVAAWVDQVLPAISSLAESDLEGVRLAYQRLQKGLPSAVKVGVDDAVKN